MKKILPLILAAALMLSLAACSKEENTSDNNKEVAENTQIIELSEIYDCASDNLANAMETYVGNPYQIFAFVTDIQADYCTLTFYNFGSIGGDTDSQELRAYLPSETLSSLQKGCGINIAGTIESIGKQDREVSGYNLKCLCVNMKEANYIDNIHELTGIINEVNLDESYCIVTQNVQANNFQSTINVISYLDTESLKSLNEGDTITLEGNMRFADTTTGDKIDGYLLDNAKVIE